MYKALPTVALLLASSLLAAAAPELGPEPGPEAPGEQAPARFGLTFSTNTFQPADGLPEYPVTPGLYARAGLCWLPGNRLELELFHLPRLVPEPYSELFLGLSVGCWILPRKRNSYFNLTADAAFLHRQDGRNLLALRLCPIVLGGPYYRYADRLLAVALVWNPEDARLFWQLQLVGLSLFF